MPYSNMEGGRFRSTAYRRRSLEKGALNTMKDAAYWIRKLGLARHPEGGYFRQTYRTGEMISASALPGRFTGSRPVSTAIYYLLGADEFSAFHSIKSDELWHFYSGAALTIHIIDQKGNYSQVRLGSDYDRGEVFQAVVEAGCWFGAAIDNDEAMCGGAAGCGMADSDAAGGGAAGCDSDLLVASARVSSPGCSRNHDPGHSPGYSPPGYGPGHSPACIFDYALVGCTVAPGFDFSDFLLADRRALIERYPEHKTIIEKLTR